MIGPNMVTPKERQYNKRKEKDRPSSKVFGNDAFCNSIYLEKVKDNSQSITIIFRRPEEINSKNSIIYNIDSEKISHFKEITLIFDFDSLSQELFTFDLKSLFFKFYNNINFPESKLNLIIKNCYIDPDKEITPILDGNKIILNKLEISDELYSLSTKGNLNKLLPSLEVNELVLKKFKFNSKDQISHFLEFIINADCRKLTLEDIFIELILKRDENDDEFNDLDIYFSYADEVIIIDGNLSNITSLTMRDAPLFAIIGDMFTRKDLYNKDSYKTINISENSLINPSILTKFKIDGDKFDICFDLDSYKLKLEENENKEPNYDYIDYLDYIFNIIIKFERKKQKIIEDNKNKESDEEDGLGEIYRKHFHKLIFKNFDETKFDFIYDDDMTFIEEKNWVLNNEEKAKKERWEKLDRDLEEFNFEALSGVKELIFDNCSSFFIKWILQFVKGKNKTTGNLDLLKFKKCSKDYIDLNYFLPMTIDKLILFDTPLIIGDNFPKDGNHLDNMKYKLGTIDNLTVKINSLDSYGKQYNLNTYKTYEILIELFQKNNFNRNITFELSALSNFMTFIAFRTYLKNQEYYNAPSKENDGKDNIDNEKEKKEKVEKENDNMPKIKKVSESLTLPTYIFFDSKKNRDLIYKNAFNIECLENKTITIKNATIKKTTENFENQNDLTKKYVQNNKSYTDNEQLKKIDFGSDGFYIDRDFKYFFSENKIQTVELRNVAFSNYKDNTLKSQEEETIINLISSKNENNDIIHFPNYIMDVKTLNGIVYKNFLFEDIGSMFKYFMYKIELKDLKDKKGNAGEADLYEKKDTLMDYFVKLKNIIECFKKNIGVLTIIINNVKELKELYCTFAVLKIVVERKWKEEEMIGQGKKKKNISLPDIDIIEEKIGIYFLKEKNEDENDMYSDMNYYYTSDEEEKMLENQKFEIDNYNINIKCEFDINKELI